MTDLLPGVSGTDRQKADTIYACTVLGFCAVHGELGHHLAFEAEAWNTKAFSEDSDSAYMAELGAYQDFLDLLSAMSAILDDTVEKGAGRWIKDHTSPTLDHHNVMICGWPGGQGMQPHARVFVGDRLDDPSLTRPSGPERHQSIMNTIGPRVTAEVSTELGYLGPGAYTGSVMEKGKEAVFSSTTQCIPAENIPTRWTPVSKGLIDGAHANGRPKGFGTPPTASVCGYSHGMNYAMRDALDTSPTAVAIEIASGQKTTKLASCFGCTTYMWANGFPPSATHLGSALSWHPLNVALETDDKKRAIVQSMNVRYHLQVHGYIMRGAEIYLKAGKASGGNGKYYVTSTRRDIARGLLRLQGARTPRAHEIGANYFLDACMDHQNDKVRLGRAILTHFNGREKV